MLDEMNSLRLFKQDLNRLTLSPPEKDHTIPKIFHFIYIPGGHPFVMAHYIAVRSCFEVNKPDKILIWHGRETAELKYNTWWKMARKYSTLIEVRVPTYVNGRNIPFKQHQADLMRIVILNRFGGVYMDVDVMSLQPLDGSTVRPIFETEEKGYDLYGKQFVMCRESPDKLCNCVIMSRKGHPLLQAWEGAYERTYGTIPDWWGGLSVVKPNELARAHPEWKVCILKTRSFLPFLFNDCRIFVQDIGDVVSDSLTAHLWDTESFKYGWIPIDVDYFDTNPESTFAKLFRKYVE
jgi:Glycosyltransferase sugar-binding region containing DXD motif